MKKFVIAVIGILLLSGVIIVSFGSSGYEKAYEKTEKLISFEVTMSTVVGMREGDSHRQSVIDQVLSVENFGKNNMKYKVSANSASTDETGKVVEEVSEYTYYDEEYYLSLPGIKYKSFCGFDAAMSNIDDLVHAVSFPMGKMYNVEKTIDGDKVYYEYDVEYTDVSNHVKTALQSAINNYQDTNFSVKEVSARAVTEGDYVVERSLKVVYESNTGVEIALEVTSSLTKDSCSVEIPDASKYASM